MFLTTAGSGILEKGGSSLNVAMSPSDTPLCSEEITTV